MRTQSTKMLSVCRVGAYISGRIKKGDGNHEVKKEMLFILCDDDENELPIMVTGTAGEMAKKTNSKVDTIHSAISRKQKLIIDGKKYKIARIYCDSENL